jgi:hypothetical protein
MERVKSLTHPPDHRRILFNSSMEGVREKSGTYAACEQMIQMSFMVMQLGALDQILGRFEKNGRLSPREHQGLLQYARRLWDTAA